MTGDSYRDIALREMGLAPAWVRKSVGAPADESAVPAGEVDLAAGTIGPAARAPLSPGSRPTFPSAGEPSIETMDWQTLQSAVSVCPKCRLCESRTQTVFGVGSSDASWMLIGEAPGAEEDARGEPFVGQAGRLLDNMLASISLSRREGMFITNVLKCRPPGNRNPAPDEVAACAPYLSRQIALIRPKLIVVLGRFAAQSLLNTEASIASLRGKVHEARFGELTIPVVVTYHPAYLLRSLGEKAKAWADLCLVKSLIEKLER